MNSRHIVQLRSPWELELDTTQDQPAGSVSRRIRVPIDLRAELPEWTAETVTISRRFHSPRTLDPGEKVFCRLVDLPGLVELRLNDHSLPFDAAQTPLIEHDISHLLQANNLLALRFSLADIDSERPVGLLGEVSLQFGPE